METTGGTAPYIPCRFEMQKIDESTGSCLPRYRGSAASLRSPHATQVQRQCQRSLPAAESVGILPRPATWCMLGREEREMPRARIPGRDRAECTRRNERDRPCSDCQQCALGALSTVIEWGSRHAHLRRSIAQADTSSRVAFSPSRLSASLHTRLPLFSRPPTLFARCEQPCASVHAGRLAAVSDARNLRFEPRGEHA